VIILKKRNSNNKIAVFLLAAIFVVSTFMVIQPFSKEALANTTISANTTILQLEEQESQDASTKAINQNIPGGETKLPPTGTTGGTTMITTIAEQSNPSAQIYPSKIGTVSVIGGNAISTGTVGK
jgi:hypothetical protein